MNWQKLNEVETYTNLWNKFKGLFGRKKADDSSNDSEEPYDDSVPVTDKGLEGKSETEEVIDSSKATEQKNTESNAITNDEVVGVNYSGVFHAMKRYKWLYIIIIPIVGILASIYIVSFPREYTTSTEMVPEVESPTSTGGGLSSLASSFGIDLSNMQSTDAIAPILYPDLMNDNKFVSEFFSIQVKTVDDSIHTDYYSFLKNNQKRSPIGVAIDGFFKKFTKEEKTAGPDSTSEFNPYFVSKNDADIISQIRKDVEITTDKKTGAITITTTSQDPMVAKILADSANERLQAYITKYRTNKAKEDVEYYTKLTDDAKKSYEKVRREYAEYSDANQDVILESVKSKEEDLENEMQLRYNSYTAMSTQLQMARAKLRKMTPVFITIQGASVPIKPTKPKRMIFVIVWIFLAFVGVTIYAMYKITRKPSAPKKKGKDNAKV